MLGEYWEDMRLLAEPRSLEWHAFILVNPREGLEFRHITLNRQGAC